MPPLPRDPSSTSLSSVHRTDSSKTKASSSSFPPLIKNDMVKKGCGAVGLNDWGFPGHLTEAEFKVYEVFRNEVYKRGGDFQSTVFTFELDGEDEAYALCRWLRARKFILYEVINMVEEATKVRAEPSKANFYPDPSVALGVEQSIYFAQYPQLYCGFAKEGYPLFVSKPGILCVGGLECITTIDGILRYHWNEMMHNYASNLRLQSASNSKFKRFECVCVIDLANLSSSQVSKRALNIVKAQSKIDSLCFPETLHKMIVVNAPAFFTLTWKMMKGWVDARTANKVEIISSRSKWEKRLKELVNDDQLPSDYGGKNESTSIQERTMQKARDKRLTRQITKLLSVRSTASMEIDVAEGEVMHVSVFTRSLSGGVFFITSSNREKNKDGIVVKHHGQGIEQEEPTRVDFEKKLYGPGKYKLKVESNGGAFSTEQFLLAGRVLSEKAKQSVITTKAISVVPARSTRKKHSGDSDAMEEKKEESAIIKSKNGPDGTTHSLVDVPLSSPDSKIVKQSKRNINGGTALPDNSSKDINEKLSSSFEEAQANKVKTKYNLELKSKLHRAEQVVRNDDNISNTSCSDERMAHNDEIMSPPSWMCGSFPTLSNLLDIWTDPFATKTKMG